MEVIYEMGNYISVITDYKYKCLDIIPFGGVNMKRVITISVLMFFLSITTFSSATNARNTQVMDFPSSPKLNNQLFGYFMLDLYHKGIVDHIKSYYKDENINGYTMPENRESVLIRTTRNLKDLENRFSYILKTTVLPTNENGTVVGIDTLYFAVEPSRANITNLPKGIPQIKLIKYEHKEIKKK